MLQQGQAFELTSPGTAGESFWASRYRTGGRGSKRVQRGGFASEDDARAALGRALEATTGTRDREDTHPR